MNESFLEIHSYIRMHFKMLVNETLGTKSTQIALDLKSIPFFSDMYPVFSSNHVL